MIILFSVKYRLDSADLLQEVLQTAQNDERTWVWNSHFFLDMIYVQWSLTQHWIYVIVLSFRLLVCLFVHTSVCSFDINFYNSSFNLAVLLNQAPVTSGDINRLPDPRHRMFRKHGCSVLKTSLHICYYSSYSYLLSAWQRNNRIWKMSKYFIK